MLVVKNKGCINCNRIAFILLIFINKTSSQSTCSESSEWYYDENLNNTCVYEECICEPTGINNTEIQECTIYPVTSQSSMQKYKDICDDVNNAGCTDVRDLSFVRCGTFTEQCSLYCSCNTSNIIDTENDLYYSDIDIYSKQCYSCQCEQISFAGENADVWNCGTFESDVNINDDDWDSWTCPEKVISYVSN